MKYQIVQADNSLILERRVRRKIAEDWQPLGAPFIVAGPHWSATWYQAMTQTPEVSFVRMPHRARGTSEKYPASKRK